MGDVIPVQDQAMELYRAGRFEEAAGHWQQVYQASLAGGDLAAAARALNDQGVCWRQAARFDEAEQALSEARAIFQKLGDVCGEAQVVGNLAALYESRHKDARAIDLYREAIALLDRCGEPTLSRETWMALGRLRLRRREWWPAFAAYEMSLSDTAQLTVAQRALRGLLRVGGAGDRGRRRLIYGATFTRPTITRSSTGRPAASRTLRRRMVASRYQPTSI